MIPVALALGSNLGDRMANLRLGAAGLSRVLEDLRFSSAYQTDPEGVTDQPQFLNAACTGRTDLRPRELLQSLKEIEAQAGRDFEARRWGPRPLDLDILLYGERIVRGEGLEIPHPRMARRAFVLVPLAEIAPEWRHPGLGRTVGELRERVDASDVELYAREWPTPGDGREADGKSGG